VAVTVTMAVAAIRTVVAEGAVVSFIQNRQWVFTEMAVHSTYRQK